MVDQDAKGSGIQEDIFNEEHKQIKIEKNSCQKPDTLISTFQSKWQSVLVPSCINNG